MEIVCDFYHDFISFCKAELNSFGYSTDGKNEEDVDRMFWMVFYRIPSMRPRKIHTAKNFFCHSELEDGLKKLEGDVECGNLLKPYLSTNVDFIADKRFYDKLLSDWNIHHFHLGTTMQSNRFVDRTGNLLFATLDDDNFYEIAIMDHRDHWTEKDLLEIININWPELINKFVFKNISIQSNFTKDNIKKFRKKGIQSLVKLADGKVLAPLGGGYSTDGTPMDVIQKSDYMKIKLRKLKQDYERPDCKCIPENYKTGELLKIQAEFSCQDIFNPRFKFVK